MDLPGIFNRTLWQLRTVRTMIFRSPCPRPARGSAAIEFALIAVVFFSFVFGTLELARALFLWSTLTEVVSRTARGASMTNPSDASAMGLMRQNAMLRNSAGKLLLGGAIDDSYLRVDYLARDQATYVTVLPPCPVQNLVNCANDANGASCIRFIQVRLCMPGTNCDPVPYAPMVAIGALSAFHFDFPRFTTIVAAQTLGMPAACTP
jgi:hypothetical protein